MSFPRKRESIHTAAFLDPRFRGGDRGAAAHPSFCRRLLRKQTRARLHATKQRCLRRYGAGRRSSFVNSFLKTTMPSGGSVTDSVWSNLP
jgi:hypothetical protein